jgi:hypothetical protein
LRALALTAFTAANVFFFARFFVIFTTYLSTSPEPRLSIQ